MTSNEITLRDFLKKFTAISNKFIDEYVDYYDKCKNKKFGILLEDVANFLKIKGVERFYEKFRKRYKLNKDYVITRLKTKRTKGKKSVMYYISFDTFEKICMRTNAKKGNEVRDYFTLLRKFVDHYKQNISDAIIQNITDGKHKYMYIILVNKNKNIFKAGRSNDIRERMKNYAVGKDTHPDIKFIMLVDDPLIVEKCSKLFLKEYQYKNKELYQVDIDTIKQALFECATLNRNMDEHHKKLNEINNVDAYVVYDENVIEYLDENENVTGYEKIKIKKQTGGHATNYKTYVENKHDYIVLKTTYGTLNRN